MTTNVIWLEANIDNNINSIRSREIEKFDSLNIKLFKKTEEAIKCLKKIQFEKTKIIIGSSLYREFIKKFKENILEICVVPKFIVFDDNKENLIKYNEDFTNNNNTFYHYGGIVIDFEKVKEFLNNTQKNSNEKDSIIKSNNLSNKIGQKSSIFLDVERKYKYLNLSNDSLYTFEYINKKEQLMFPLFFKALIDYTSNDDSDKYINILYNKYSKESKKLENLLGQIESIKDIPIEILSKYFARLYTIHCNFHKDLNRDLRFNRKDKHLTYIQTLYEGVKLKSIDLATDNILYRGSILSNNEINKIENYINNKIDDLPSSIVFSKSFLSFSKSYDEAIQFLEDEESDEKFSKILFILEKDDKIGYSLSTHGDIEKLSFYPKEKEVLFFPFSSFEVKSLEKINIGKEKEEGYQIKLLYLGKYLENIENDKKLILKENKLPDCPFKTELTESGLINSELMQNMNTKSIYNAFQNYVEDIGEKSDIAKNVITGEIKIDKNDINKPIQIMNKYENVERTKWSSYIRKDYEYINEKNFKRNVVIKINGEKIKSNYYHIFEDEGIYKIKYFFYNNLTNTSYMFYGCSNIINLDLSKFDSQNVTNMSHMFQNCDSLNKIILSKFNAENIKNMSYVFSGCKLLNNLDLSDFDTKNVIYMNCMFSGCASLKELNLYHFNTKNVINMSFMFNECKNLLNLNLSKFDTFNVVKMRGMFNLCNNLINLDISNFNTINVVDMSYMFYCCKSLNNFTIPLDFINKNTKVNNMLSGSSLKIKENISNYNKNKNEINKIIGEINIMNEDVNIPIQIINSFENWKSQHMNKGVKKENDEDNYLNNENEDELKKNIEIKINGKKISFAYLFSFEKQGKYEIEYIFKKNLTNTNFMFYQCRNITKLIFSKFNTDNVTNMKWMFRDCYNLKELDLSMFNTKNVGDMSYMFSGCKSLIYLDISNFNTNNVNDMSYMFYWCKSLKKCNYPFSCFSVLNPILKRNFIFENCDYFHAIQNKLFHSNLIEDSDSDSKEALYISNNILDENKAKSIIIGKIKINKKDINEPIRLIDILIKGDIAIKINGEISKSIYYQEFTTEGIYKIEYFFFNNLTKTSYMYYGCSNIISLDLSKFDSQKVTNMSYMFSGCELLKSLNLSGINTQNVNNMSYMFQDCCKLTNLDLSGFNTKNVKYMNNMFQNCAHLTYLNILDFNTINVINMNNMFLNCSHLTNINLSNFNTINVKNMSYMFSGCKSLKNIDVLNFNTQNVINMKGLFNSCSSITNLELSNFITTNVTNMSLMFSGCELLKILYLSKFTAEKITNISFMFYGCKSLTYLDLSNFNLVNLVDLDFLFDHCNSLNKENIITKDIQILNKFDEY